jgi:hypothetical protein
VTYLWENIGNSDTSFVSNLSANRYYHVTVSDAMGCVIYDSITLGEPDPIEIGKDFSNLVCSGESDGFIDINLTGGTEPYSFAWSNGATSEDISGLKPGKYYYEVIDSNGCTATDTIMLDSSIVYQGSELCLLTVNNQNKILIVWEKEYDAGILAYRIYREQTKDNYVFIKEVPFDSLSIYLDKASQPEKWAHYYKITAVDACGNESEYSDFHKTIKLNTLPGLSGEIILQWEEYLGFDYSEYRIYRGRTLTDLHEIEIISSNSKSYTDPTPPAGQIYYRVEVVKQEPCFPTINKADEYGSTVSNYDEEIIESVRSLHDRAISIFPHPVADIATLEFPNPDNLPYKLILTDLTGKVVRTIGKITGSRVELKRDNLTPGTYIIELRGDKIYRGKLLIE